MITKRPALVLIAGVLGLGIIAIPTMSLYLGLPDDGTASAGQHQTRGLRPDLAVLRTGHQRSAADHRRGGRPADDGQGAAGHRAGDPAANSRCRARHPRQVSQDGTFGIVTVVPKSGPSDEATQTTGAQPARPGAGARCRRSARTIAVTGLTAVGDRRLGQTRRRAAGLSADRGRVGFGAAAVDLPVDRRPGGRRARLPADHRRLVRRRGRGLPVGLAERASSGSTPRRRSSASCPSC